MNPDFLTLKSRKLLVEDEAITSLLVSHYHLNKTTISMTLYIIQIIMKGVVSGLGPMRFY